MFLEFNSPSVVTVGQLYIFSNKGDKAYASTPDHPLNFSLPAGAIPRTTSGKLARRACREQYLSGELGAH